jgi:hypothetical protein
MNSKKRYNVIMNFHSILKKERKTQNNKIIWTNIKRLTIEYICRDIVRK